MVIQTDPDTILPVGFHETGENTTADANCQEHRMAFIVIREATREEFIAQCEEAGVPAKIMPGARFYLVATD